MDILDFRQSLAASVGMSRKPSPDRQGTPARVSGWPFIKAGQTVCL
jgi:hypothetical protein